MLVTGTAAGMKKTEYATKPLSKKVENQDQVPFKKCFNCGYKEHGLSPEDKKENCKAMNETCNSCKKKGHFSSVCKSKEAETLDVSGEDVKEEVPSMRGEFFSISALVERPEKLLQKKQDGRRMRRLNHHAFTAFGKWEPAKVEYHPRVKIRLTVAREDYNSLQLPEPEVDQTAVKKARQCLLQEECWGARAESEAALHAVEPGRELPLKLEKSEESRFVMKNDQELMPPP